MDRPLWDIKDFIVHEDPHLIVVNKPSGLMVEPDRNNHPNLLTLLKSYLKTEVDKNPYAQHIHRLDRPVSGLVLFAKKREVLKPLSEQFAQRTVKKSYLALTLSKPSIEIGTLEHWHRKEKKKGTIVHKGTEYAEEVRLSYKINAEKYGEYYHWDIDLHTGKFHQIRAQLSHIGCPILGDALYGSTESFTENSIALHASRLVFLHPVTQNHLSFEVDPNWIM